MTADDITQAAADYELHRRAFAACMVAEPHRDADEDLPCSRHLLDAARQLAISAQLSASASTLATGGTAAAGAGVDGAAGRVLGPPSGQVGGSTLQTDNQPRTVNPRLADGGPVRPQNESMP